jgi:hypothetical protein
MNTASELADELEALSKDMHVRAPWKNENPRTWVWGPSDKGGDTHVLDIRGWGYLTGGGSGALDLPHDEACKRQDATGSLVVGLVNNLPIILSALRQVEVMREALREIVETGDMAKRHAPADDFDRGSRAARGEASDIARQALTGEA